MKLFKTSTSEAKPATGRIYYSNMVSKTAPGLQGKSMYLYQHSEQKSRLYLVANSEENKKGRIVMFDPAGDLLISQLIKVYKGKTTIEVAENSTSLQPPRLIAVYLDEQLAFMQQLAS